MSNSPNPVELMEDVYEILADAIDQVPAPQCELFLTKLALLMARDAGNAQRLRELTEIAARDL